MLAKIVSAVAACLAGVAVVAGFGFPVQATVRPDGSVPDPIFHAVWCSGPRQCLAVGNAPGASGHFQPISAVWNGRSWRFVPTPDKGRELIGLACSSWHHCMAIGSVHGVIDEWNGRSWRKLRTPSASLYSIACPERNRCLAVGSTLYGTKRPGAFEWKGKAWFRVRVPRPANATSSQFTGVACAGPADCLAVGSYDANGRFGFSMAMRWNGTRWRRVAAPRTGSIACSAESRCVLSCQNRRTCIAVVNSVSLIWNGHSWRTMAVPHVDGLLASISCTRSFCVAVGDDSSADVWNGRKWSAMPGTGIAGLAVWCTERTACMAVGEGAGAGLVSASFWNGRRWMPIRLLKFDELFAVSCTPPNNCIALGDTNDLALASAGLAERWNGSAWRLMAAPGNGISPISCASTQFCMAVSESGAKRWNGTRWIETNLPAGQFGTTTADVSCSSASNCVEVGGPNAWIWNGTSWHVNNPDISGTLVQLQTVSCASATMCMALGYDLSSTCEENCTVNLLAEQWNGSTWSVSDNAAFGVDTQPFSPVSCPSTTFCVQVTGSVAMAWNGQAWTQQTASLPNFVLGDISCASTSSCMMVGDYAVSNVTSANAAQVWDGTSWRATRLAVPSGMPNAVSCSAPDQCVAVGTTADDLSLAESWNGTAWKRLRTINP